MSVSIWAEDYRPETVDEYVWRDEKLRAKVLEWIAARALPHLLLSGRSGTGKTSLAMLLLKQIGIPAGDILFIPASTIRKVDEVQERILNFMQTYPMIDNDTGLKYIILDEADALSIMSQKFLRTEMESNSSNCRIIMTCNYPERIEKAISGRCQKFHFDSLDKVDFITRVGEILARENVEFDVQTLVSYVDATYPDLRDCIGSVQLAVTGGKLQPLTGDEISTKDFIIEAAEMFRAGQHKAARELIVQSASVEEYPEIYRFMYQNLTLWSEDLNDQEEALLIIRDAVYKHAVVFDPEINLSACLVQLTRLLRK